MLISQTKRLLDKYRPLFLLLLSCFYFQAEAQTYNPSTCCTVSNKSYGAAQAVSTDGRSWFYDATNFVMRDYNGTSEVVSYLNLAKYRSGHFPIFVHSGGILQGNGVWLGGTTLVYWFKDSTGNANLVRWYTDSTGMPGGPFYAVANNLSEGNAGLIKGNLLLDLVNNTSDAQKNAATVSLTNHTIDANNNTLLHIPNSALTNSSTGLTINSNPASDISVTTTPAALGTSLVVNMPSAGTASRGPLSATDWNFFNGKLDSVHISNDSVYNCVNGTCTLQSVIIGAGAVNSVNGTNTSLLFSPSTGNVLGQVNPSFAFTWTGQHTFTSFAPIFSTLTTAGGLFYGNGSGQLLQSGAGTSGQILQSSGGTAPVYFTPNASTVNGWLGYTALSAALGSTHLFVGNGSNIATDVAPSGAWTMSNTGVSTLTANSVATSNIQNNAVTYAKFQALSGQALLGTQSAGNVQQITLGTNLSMTAGVLNATTGGADLTKAKAPLILNSTKDSIRLDTVWNRAGTVLYPDQISQFNFAEPNVIRDTGSHLLGVPATDTIFKMWYTSGWSTPWIAYAESPTGLPGTWVQYAPHLIENHCRGFMLRDGANYYIYADSSTAGLIFNRFVSTDGINFTKDHANMLTPNSTTNHWNTTFGNPAVYKDGGTWYLLMDGLLTNRWGYTTGLYTSTNGFTWTEYTAGDGNPVLKTLGATWFTKIGTRFWIWGHTSYCKEYFPNNVYTWYSDDSLKTFHQTNFPATFHALTSDEGVDSVHGGVGDVFLLRVNNQTFMYYAGAKDASAITGQSHLKVAVANMSLDSLVNTTENALVIPRWESHFTTMAYLNGPIGIGTQFPHHYIDVVENQNINQGGVVATPNLLSYTGNLLRVGYNVYNYNGVPKLSDSTQTGMNFAIHQNGIRIETFNATSGTPTTTTVAGWDLTNGYGFHTNTFSVGAASDDGSGAKLQVTGNVKIAGNVISAGTYNGIQINTGGGSIASNIAIGGINNALQANTTGTGNTVMGPNALNTNSTGSGNTVMGNNAANAITGSFNTVIGQIAAVNATNTSYNVAVGRAALNALTTGSGHVSIGASSGIGTSTGVNNVFVGDSAGYTDGTITTPNGSQMAAFGYKSQVIASNTMALGGVNFPYNIGMNLPDAKAQTELTWNGAAAGKAPLKFRIPYLATTGASGSGGNATLTFATQSYKPFRVGEKITVAGVTPSGYNGTYTVLSVSTAAVSYANATTGSQTVAGTITGSNLMTTPEAGAMETDGLYYTLTDATGARDTIGMRAWVRSLIAGIVPGVSRISPLDSLTKDAKGIQVSGISLVPQTADASFAGLVSTGVQTFAGAKTFNATVTGNSLGIFFHYISGAAAPSAAAGAGAGTSPTISVTGTDQDGVIEVTTGTLPTAAATILTATYNLAFATNSFPTLTPANATTALLSGVGMVYTTGSTTTFTLTSGATALTAATTYKWYYHVGGN